MLERIKKVQYRSDGAANLASTLHYLIQPLWQTWAGIVEEVTKHCPAADGKSELDGNFGITPHMLYTQHNLGFSFNDMESIVHALTADDVGTTSTTYAVFMPERNFTMQGEINSDLCNKSVLRSNLQKYGSLITF